MPATRSQGVSKTSVFALEIKRVLLFFHDLFMGVSTVVSFRTTRIFALFFDDLFMGVSMVICFGTTLGVLPFFFHDLFMRVSMMVCLRITRYISLFRDFVKGWARGGLVENNAIACFLICWGFLYSSPELVESVV